MRADSAGVSGLISSSGILLDINATKADKALTWTRPPHPHEALIKVNIPSAEKARQISCTGFY
jgi:hypothetical protein